MITRRLLRALSSGGHPRGRRQDLENQQSAAMARTAPPRSISTISRSCLRSKSSPSTNARATGAACSARMYPASNGAMARWAARAGKARAEGHSRPRPASRRRRSKSWFDGADGPCSTRPRTSLRAFRSKALEDNTIIAYEMNGAAAAASATASPRALIVPGWTGTYWMKHVTSIQALTKPLGGFWMNPAYRHPARQISAGGAVHLAGDRDQHAITEIVVNSLITSPEEGAHVRAGQRTTIGGIAWDGGYGISNVEVSSDDGKTWRTATLGPDLGRYAFRPWRPVAANRSGLDCV